LWRPSTGLSTFARVGRKPREQDTAGEDLRSSPAGTYLMEPTRGIPIAKVDGESYRRTDDVLAQECQVTLSVDGKRLTQVVCSPGRLRELAYGHLLSIGWIRSPDDIMAVEVDDTSIDVQLASGVPSPRVEAEVLQNTFSVSKHAVVKAVLTAQSHGALFQITGSTHLAGLFPSDSDMVAVEDISRTCALSKALGVALLHGMPFDQSLLVLTSRVPMSFVETAARAGIPMIAAVSSPTYQAVTAAERLGICLCGFVRGERLNVYSQPWRVGLT